MLNYLKTVKTCFRKLGEDDIPVKDLINDSKVGA